MAFFLSKIQPQIYRSIIKSTQVLINTHQFSHSFSEPPEDKDAIFTSICDSLSKGLSWDSLTQKFGSIHLSNPLIQKVLLQFKEPIYAKQVLKFFHWSAHHMHFQHGISNYCITIHILVKARLFRDAKALLESILAYRKPIRDGSDEMFNKVLVSLLDSYEIVDSTPFVFDLYMQTCGKLRIIDNVVDACKNLDEHGFGLSVISYNTLLHVMQKSENKTYLIWSLYEHMIEKKMYPNEVTYRILVSALGKEGRLKRVLDMVERMHGKRCSSPGVVVNTCLVFGMIDEGKIGDGVNLLKRMLQKNMIPDAVSFSLGIMAKARVGDLNAAWDVYEEMRKRGFEGNSFVSTLFIGAYCKEGRVDEAIVLMQEMDDLGMKPYDETFNHLIEGCSRKGYLEESLKFCQRMINMGLLPSCLTFNNMVRKFCSNGEAKRADEMLTVLLEKGFISDENTYSHLANGYMKLGDVEGILKLYYEMEYRSLSPSSSSLSSLIISLCQHGRVREADKYLFLLKARSLTPGLQTYETLIASHLEKGDKTRAQQLYEEMVGNELKTGE